MADLPVSITDALGGRYRIVRELGSGGMALVYLAEDLRHPRSVAIKVMRPALIHASGLERFRRELEIAAGLSHPRILPLIDSGVVDGVMWFAMPYVSGGSLRARLGRESPLPIADALVIAHGVAGALAHAHRQGVIHRDVKPENILMMDNEPLLADFGLAHLTSPEPGFAVSTAGFAMGTPGYMSPEQYAGGSIDARTDVYGLACVLFEMLAGRAPFIGSSAEAVAFQHLNAEPPNICDLRPQASQAVARMLQRALSKRPSDRFATADEFRLALEEATALTAASRVAVASAETIDAMPAVTSRRRRLPSWHSGVAKTALVALAIAVSFGVWRVFLQPTRRGGDSNVAVDPDTRMLVVLPFAGHVPASSRYMVDAVRTLLTGFLDGYADMRCIAPARIDDAVRADGSVLSDEQSARRLTSRLGADRLVQGSVLLTGHTVRIEAALRYRVGGRDTSVTATAEGEVDSLARVVEAVARRIITSSLSEPDEVWRGLASLGTPSLEALKAYQAAMAQTSLPAQLDLLERATQADSNFAMAWSQLAAVQGWLGQYEASVRSSDHALRLGSRLPLRTRLLLEARTAQRRADAERSERLYQRMIAEYPDDAEAWRGLGDNLFLFNTLRGRRTLEARAPLLEAVRLDTSLTAEVYEELERIGITTGDIRWTDSLYRAHPGYGVAPWASAWLDFMRADPRRRLQLISDAAGSDPGTTGVRMVGAMSAGDADAAMQLGRVFIRKQPEPMARAEQQLTLAMYAAGGGRLLEARSLLRSADAVDSLYARTLGALLLASDFIPASSAELDSMRRALARLDPRPVADPDESVVRFAQAEGDLEPVRLYVLGLLDVRQGRVADARAMVTTLDHVAGRAETVAWARNYSLGVQAALDARTARWGDVVAKLDHLTLGTKPGGRMVFHNHLQERFLRARALRASGDLKGALAWFECMSDVFIVDHALLGPCALNEAEICESLGRTNEAIRHYRFFCKLWSTCDPELLPTLERARQHLVKLEASRS